MPSLLPRFTFRTDAETLKKLRYIADSNFRTTNRELERLVKEYIISFEDAHGVIHLPKD